MGFAGNVRDWRRRFERRRGSAAPVAKGGGFDQ